MNDLININTKLRFLIYADDTTMYYHLEDFTHLNIENEINDEVEKNNYMVESTPRDNIMG